MIQTTEGYILDNNGILVKNKSVDMSGVKYVKKMFTEIEKGKLEAGYSYNIETEEFEETIESEEFEKQSLILEYKSNLDEIKETTAEMSEVEETKQYFPEIAEKRLEILTEKRTTLREANGLLVAEGVSKYGENILFELT